ncbi:MAG: hydroxymethylbilane synthase [Planctomycetota bacterium]|nr:hydroxymethylbilane synthase [Planctomycetota bacterium]
METILLGTRGSSLALVQSEWFAGELKRAWPELNVELKQISTTGDSRDNVPFAQAGGKGIFTREIDNAQVNGEIDIAVHSMKDVPTELPEGLTIAAVPERECPNDVGITREGSFSELPRNATIGTSSIRRQAFLKAWRPDLNVIEFRGNVDTRLRKLKEGQADAIILAAAGLRRLGIEHDGDALPFDLMLPAPGQGALAITSRQSDERARELLSPLDHPPTHRAADMERALLGRLGGTCQIPFGAQATPLELEDQFDLVAAVCHPNGTSQISARQTGQGGSRLSSRVYAELESQGLDTFMDEITEFLKL